jgi:hypothetical protein
MNLKIVLRGAALILATASVLFWAATGAHRGWTKTSVPIPKKDPVTDQDYVEWQKKFVPGVELLATGLGMAAALFGLSFWKFKNRNESVGLNKS